MVQAIVEAPSREEVQENAALRLPHEAQADGVLADLLAALSDNPYWYERRVAARKLGELGSDEAAAGLRAALLNDPFWKVRCAIIQSLERIGDARGVSVLQVAADSDPSHIVREYAAAVVRRLSLAC
jgi:HEAT repeat protein